MDHRDIGTEVGLGGTSCMFELEVMRGNRLRVRVGDAIGDAATIEQLFSPDCLARVTYDGGVETIYDYEGRLQKVTMPLMASLLDLNDQILEQLDGRVLEAATLVLGAGGEIIIEADLRDGIAQGDGSGWVQIIYGPNLVKEKDDSVVGGFEIGPGITMEPFSILLIDQDREPLVRVYVRVEIRGEELCMAVGDGRVMAASRYLRAVNPDRISEIGKPRGALRFLVSLVPNQGSQF